MQRKVYFGEATVEIYASVHSDERRGEKKRREERNSDILDLLVLDSAPLTVSL